MNDESTEAVDLLADEGDAPDEDETVDEDPASEEDTETEDDAESDTEENPKEAESDDVEETELADEQGELNVLGWPTHTCKIAPFSLFLIFVQYTSNECKASHYIFTHFCCRKLRLVSLTWIPKFPFLLFRESTSTCKVLPTKQVSLLRPTKSLQGSWQETQMLLSWTQMSLQVYQRIQTSLLSQSLRL